MLYNSHHLNDNKSKYKNNSGNKIIVILKYCNDNESHATCTTNKKNELRINIFSNI